MTSEVGFDFSTDVKYEYSIKNDVVIFVREGNNEYDFRDFSVKEISANDFTDSTKYRDNFLNMIKEASKTAVKEVKDDVITFFQTDITGVTYQYTVKNDRITDIKIRVNEYLKTYISFEYKCDKVTLDKKDFK